MIRVGSRKGRQLIRVFNALEHGRNTDVQVHRTGTPCLFDVKEGVHVFPRGPHYIIHGWLPLYSFTVLGIHLAVTK